MSDLHMESYYFEYQYQGEDIVLLLGDIHTQNRHSEILEQIPSNIPIILIMGNHEPFGNDFADTHKNLKELKKFYPNLHYLNNESFDIGDVSFYGGTMWTDFNLFGYNSMPYVVQDATRYIADFRYISRENRLWNIDDVLEQYNLFNKNFDYWVKNANGKTKVCLSHFLPSIKCVDSKFTGSILNGYFASNQENRINLVDYWFSGHTHASYNFMINETNLVCNPKGYGSENLLGFNPKLVIEII